MRQADEWGVENRMVLIDVSEQFTQDAQQDTHWPFSGPDWGRAACSVALLMGKTPSLR